MTWEKVTLGSFLKVREDRFKPDDRRIAGLKRVDKIDFSGNLHLSDSPSKTDMILVKNGDLLISGINVYKGAVIVYEGKEDITATIHYSSYEFDKTKIDIDFLKLFLKSPEFLDAIKEQVPGGIKTEIKPKHFLPLEVEIPNRVEEQRELVNAFLKVEKKNTELATELTHQLDLVKQLRQAFLREAMQGKLVPQDPNDEPASELLKRIKAEKAQLIRQGKLKKEKELPPIKPEEIPFEIPENWVWCRLGEICSKITDGFHNTPRKVSKGVPYISATHVKPDRIAWEGCYFVSEEDHRELFSKAFPRKGEVLIVNIGAGCGTPAIIDVDYEFSFKNTAIMKFNQELISNRLLFYYFILRREEIYEALTKGGLQPFLSLSILNGILFPLATFSQQHHIVARLDQLMKYCDELDMTIKQSQTQNEQLLQQVLREALEPN